MNSYSTGILYNTVQINVIHREQPTPSWTGRVQLNSAFILDVFFSSLLLFFSLISSTFLLCLFLFFLISFSPLISSLLIIYSPSSLQFVLLPPPFLPKSPNSTVDGLGQNPLTTAHVTSAPYFFGLLFFFLFFLLFFHKESHFAGIGFTFCVLIDYGVSIHSEDDSLYFTTHIL